MTPHDADLVQAAREWVARSAGLVGVRGVRLQIHETVASPRADDPLYTVQMISRDVRGEADLIPGGTLLMYFQPSPGAVAAGPDTRTVISPGDVTAAVDQLAAQI